MAQDDIQGQVVDGSGSPVSGAIVELTRSYQSNPTSREKVFRTTTDSNGNYIFEGHPDGDGTTQEWHVSAYSHDGTAYVNSFNNPGVTAELPSNAIFDSVVDNFEASLYEDQKLSLSDYYGGDLSAYRRQTSTVYQGSYALEATSGQSAITDDGGDFFLTDGTTWEFYQYHTSSSADGGWMWMTQTEAGRTSRTGYQAAIRSNNDDIKLRRFVDGGYVELDVDNTSIPENEWMRGLVVHTSDGEITFTLYDSGGNQLAQTSATDTTYTYGGHGFSNYDPNIIWDNVREV